MKARVHFKTPTHSGNFEIEEPDGFKDWCGKVGKASGEGGWTYFLGDQVGFPLRYITMIEKLVN